MESGTRLTDFINFLQDELAISSSAIAVALRNRKQGDDPLPMLLWQYGLVSLEQLTQIFDWLDNQTQFQAANWLLSGELHRFAQL
jgi:Protein of unknown function (DUF2949)